MFTRALQRLLAGGGRENAVGSRLVTPGGWRARAWTRMGPSSGFGVALAAAAAVVAFVGLAAVAWQANGLRSSLQSTEADNDALRQQRDADRQRIDELEGRTAALSDELNQERANRSAAGGPSRARALVATFVLSPGLLRSTRAPAQVAIGATIDEARLQLDLEPGTEGERFRAELHDSAGRVVWTQEGLSATTTGAGRAVIVTLPAALLEAAEYEAVLLAASGRSELEEIGRYYFGVTRK